MAGLSNIADDLGAFLDEAAPAQIAKIARPRTITSEQIDMIAGGVLDLVFAKAEPGDSSDVLGEAMVVGGLAVAHDFGLHDERVAVATVEMLERMAASARSALTEAVGPTVADQKILIKVRGLKAKHISAKMVASATGVKLKPVIKALDRLQASGFLDYNLKAGYTVNR